MITETYIPPNFKREDINQLVTRADYSRYINFPVEITTEITIKSPFMVRLFQIIDQDGFPVETNRTFAYKTLGAAKTAAKNYIKHINRNKAVKSRSELDKYEDYKIIEFELIEKDIHPL